MTSISIELVPRSSEELLSQAEAIHNIFPSIDTLNIPDLLRFSIRSWDAFRIGMQYFNKVIPHLRSVDFNFLRGQFELCNIFNQIGLKRALVITGDKPQDMSRKVYRNTSLELIRVLKKRCRHLLYMRQLILFGRVYVTNSIM